MYNNTTLDQIINTNIYLRCEYLQENGREYTDERNGMECKDYKTRKETSYKRKVEEEGHGVIIHNGVP